MNALRCHALTVLTQTFPFAFFLLPFALFPYPSALIPHPSSLIPHPSAMPLLTLADAQLAYGELPLLDRAAFAMEAGERIGLIGRNGTGKSSLLGVIAGTAALDDGELRKRDGLRVVMVEQEPKLPHAPTLHASLLLRAMPAIHGIFRRSRALAHGGAARRIPAPLRRGREPRARRGLRRGDQSARRSPSRSRSSPSCCCSTSRPTTSTSTASRSSRTLLMKQPSAIVVTHDRAFLDRFATRIVELDRGLLRGLPGQLHGLRAQEGGRARRRGGRAAQVRQVLARRRKRGSAGASRRGARGTRAASPG